MNLSRLVRQLLAKYRGDESRDPDEYEETEPDEEPDRLTDGVSRRLPDPGAIADRGTRRFEQARKRAAAWVEDGSGTAQDMARLARDQIEAVWKPEDAGQILDCSRLFEPQPAAPEDIPPELLSLRWRGEALLALSSAGVLSLEEEIIHHTDRLFHSGLPTPELSERIFRRDLTELHRWIDTVPGSEVPGGGITHRLEHGHDLEAAVAIYEEHGLVGLLAWIQHVGQDVFSITGIPMPVGGQEAARLLVDGGYTSPGKAALLVSFNVAELAASFLAGAFALRLALLLGEMKTRRAVRKRCDAALEARERGDLDAVIANYAEARSLRDDPALSLALGWAYRETGRPSAESFLEFRRAALDLGAEDRMLHLDGVALSLRGLAYLLALVEAPQVLQRDDLAAAWREEMDRMVKGAVSSFEVAAISQSERPGVSIGDRDVEWRSRPLSAAANYYLAARAVAAVPFSGSSTEFPRLRTNALEMLRKTGTDVSDAEESRLSAVARRWQGELADNAGPV